MANVGNVYLGVNGQAVDLYSAKKMYVGFNNKAVEIPLGQSKFDYKTWLSSASLSATGYSSLDDVLQDELAVRKLMTIHASVDYLASWKTTDEDIVKILSNDICAKWITLRDYALDTLDREYRSLMESLGKYYYGEWAKLSESPETWGPKGNVPIMTSNTAPYGEAIASSEHSSARSAFAAFDGSDSGGWNPTSGTTTNSYVGYHFTNPVILRRVAILPDNTGATTFDRVKDFEVKASNDGSTWTTLYTGTAQSTTSAQKQYFEINNDTPYLYYIVNVLNVYSTATIIGIRTLQFYGRELKVSVPVMTSNTAPYGECFADISGPNNPAYYAFDNNDSTMWVGEYPSGTTAPFTGLGYDFGYKVVLKMAMMKLRSDQGSITYFRGSDDGTNWDDLSEQVTRSATGDAIIVDLSNNDKAYRYIELNYKINAVSRNPNASMLQFYGFDYSEYDWDADNPRHYLYDHGVEFVTFDTPPRANNVAGPNSYTIDSPTTDSNMYGMWATNVTIDLTPYDLMRICIGKELHSDLNSTGNPKQSLMIQVNTAKTAYNSGRIANRVVFVQDGDLAYNEYLDVSAVNQSAYPNIVASTDGAKGEITEWWLE